VNTTKMVRLLMWVMPSVVNMRLATPCPGTRMGTS